jgi:hypothetical protein
VLQTETLGWKLEAGSWKKMPSAAAGDDSRCRRGGDVHGA